MGEWSWGLFTLHLGTRSPVHVEIVMESLKPSETRGEMVVRNSTWSNVALTFDHEHQFNMHRICMTWPLCQCQNCFGCVVQKKTCTPLFKPCCLGQKLQCTDVPSILACVKNCLQKGHERHMGVRVPMCMWEGPGDGVRGHVAGFYFPETTKIRKV